MDCHHWDAMDKVIVSVDLLRVSPVIQSIVFQDLEEENDRFNLNSEEVM